MWLMGNFSPAQCTLLLSPSPFSSPSLYLLSLAGDGFYSFFFFFQSCQCGQGGYDNATGMKAEVGKN